MSDGLGWQRRYLQNDTPWDQGTPAPALVRFLRETGISGRVLVPGCGRGHEVRALALQADCIPTGLDLSTAALAQARELSPQSSAQFIVGDFLQLPVAWNESFDWLVEHTCFCAIAPQQRPAYVRAASRALSMGGRLFGIFYLDPDTEEGPPFAVSKDELSRLFEPHFKLLEEWVPTESFAGRENRELVRILQKR